MAFWLIVSGIIALLLVLVNPWLGAGALVFVAFCALCEIGVELGSGVRKAAGWSQDKDYDGELW